MMNQTKQQRIIPLNLEHKRLLLTIFKQGYITEEQKQIFSSLFEVETTAAFIVYNKEQLEETRKIMDEITDEMIRKNQLPNNLVSFKDGPTREQINEYLDENKINI